MRRRRTLWLSVACGLLAGCEQPSKLTVSSQPPPPVAEVARVDLWVDLLPLRPNEGSRDTGFKAVVHFYQDSPPLATPVSGPLELLLFEGSHALPDVAVLKPDRVWSFAPDRLKDYLRRGPPGWWYVLPLLWDGYAPKGRVVTLIARYDPPSGRPIYSAPVPIAVQQK